MQCWLLVQFSSVMTQRYLLLLCFLISSLLANDLHAELRPDQNFKYWQLIDRGSLSLNELTNTPLSEWTPIPNGITDFNFLESYYWQSTKGDTLWIKLELPRRIDSSRLWIELLPNVGLNGQLATFEKDHWKWNLPIGRQSGEHEQLPATFLTFVIDEPRKHKVVYLKLETSQVFHFSINIKTNDSYLNYIVTSHLFNGFIFGLFILAIIYNLAIGVSAGEKVYLYYAFYAFSITAYLLAMTGYPRLAFPEWGGDGSFSNLASLLGVFAATLFVREFLDTPKTTPKIDFILRIQQIAVFCCIFLIGFVSEVFAFSFAVILGAVAPVTTLIAGLSAWRNGHPLARYFLIAWGMFILGCIVWAWMWFGIIEPNIFTFRFFLISTVMEVMLLSLVLGYRYSELKVQTETLSADRIKFKKLTEFDHLTGTYNRIGFINHATKILNTTKENLIWLTINIDEFKSFNDTHGHIVCDQLLKGFGQSLKVKVSRDNLAAKLREKDKGIAYKHGLVGRISGGEFCILLANSTLPQARLYAERVMRDFESIKLTDKYNHQIRSTVSIGIIQVLAQEDIDSIFVRSSALLTQAKLKGTAQVVFS